MLTLRLQCMWFLSLWMHTIIVDTTTISIHFPLHPFDLVAIRVCPRRALWAALPPPPPPPQQQQRKGKAVWWHPIILVMTTRFLLWPEKMRPETWLYLIAKSGALFASIVTQCTVQVQGYRVRDTQCNAGLCPYLSYTEFEVYKYAYIKPFKLICWISISIHSFKKL